MRMLNGPLGSERPWIRKQRGVVVDHESTHAYRSHGGYGVTVVA